MGHASSAVHPDPWHLATRIFTDIEWQYQALCHGRTDWFFPDRNSDNRNLPLLPSERRAKALCARCPVRKECLEYGVADEYGIWGGTLPSERKQGGLSRGRGDGRKPRTDIDEMLDEMTEQAVSLGLMEKEGVA